MAIIWSFHLFGTWKTWTKRQIDRNVCSKRSDFLRNSYFYLASWSKVTDFYIVTKDSYFKINAVLLNFLFIEESQINVLWFSQKCEAQLFSTFIIIKINVSWAPNEHIRMISEGLCDTEDWSNGCWKFSFAITWINYIWKYIKIERCQNISQ